MNAIAHPRSTRQLQAERLVGTAALREAQALRYRVFSSEFDARLQGAEFGLDIDDYDAHCSHIGVRDLSSGALVRHHAPARSPHRAAHRPFLQRAGVQPARAGSAGRARAGDRPHLRRSRLSQRRTIAVLWGELAEVLNQGGYRYLMGCASISMRDGGVQAQAIMQRLREGHLSTELLRAEPKTPLPPLELAANVTAQLPPLLKAYMRLGAKICGEPCWDADFQVADVFILLKRDELCPRYARHFKAAV